MGAAQGGVRPPQQKARKAALETEKLNLKPRRRGRIKGREKPDFVALRPSHAWAMDFVHDACLNGTKFKCFAIVDEFTRESPAIEVSTRIPSKKVIQVLEAAFEEYGQPEIIRCDSGLKLLGHRYYDASIGRFLRMDRAMDGRNWYSYCNSEPLGFIDPEGLDPWYVKAWDWIVEKAGSTTQAVFGIVGTVLLIRPTVAFFCALDLAAIGSEERLKYNEMVQQAYKNGKLTTYQFVNFQRMNGGGALADAKDVLANWWDLSTNLW